MADSDSDSDITYFENSDSDLDIHSGESNESNTTEYYEVSDSVEEETQESLILDVEVDIPEEIEFISQNTVSSAEFYSESEQSMEPYSPEVVYDTEEETLSRLDYLRLRPRRPVFYYESPTISLEEDGFETQDNFGTALDIVPENNDQVEVAPETVPVDVVQHEQSAESDNGNQRNENIDTNSNNEIHDVIEDSVQVPTPSSACKSQGEKRPLDDSFVDDGMTCPICLDSFTNSGPHRLSSLRCGHIFGHSCVERWLKLSCTAGSRKCPTCNKKANIKDIRILYAKKLVAIDTSEIDKFKDELNQALSSKHVLDLEIQLCKLNQEMMKKELESLKQELEVTRKTAASIPDEVCHSQIISQPLGHELKLIKVIDICDIGGCRVMAYDNHMNLIVSTQSKNNLFPGYGLKKFDVLEFRPAQMIPLHLKMIRDIAFHRIEKDLLLSVSLDATAKLLDIRCNTGLNTFNGESPLWACCWDANNSNFFYVGGQSGIVNQFDTRNIHVAVNTWTAAGDRTPIVSLAGIPRVSHSHHQQAAFLSCRLNSMWAYQQENAGNWMEPQSLPIGGPFMSMSYNKDAQLILTSSRPMNRFPYTRHTLNQISENFRSCNLIHSIEGSRKATLMSRSCFVNPPSTNTCYIAAQNESAHKLEMFDSSTGQLVCSTPVSENIVDVCPVYVNKCCVLTALSDKKLYVFEYKTLL